MAATSPQPDAMTLINVFVVEPDNQQKLVEMLTWAAENVMGKQPGYRSAHIHRSLDGTKVAVYAQWRSREDFEGLANNADAAAHMGRVRALASFEPVLYEDVFTHQTTTDPSAPVAG
ncbi:antibiotic biosynthesis monooxygenase family protein [Nonomuraea sp. M3C6]|uniref:Antibiotic biosynthesis monooxygenase family protein n=1 Tax=Nonomuraea marmarensis TaxID=3351344 RepID=A0ABW7AVH2_9ACTN